MGSKTDGRFKDVSLKAHRHSDKKIKADVCDALAQASNVNCSNIETSVDGGVVTLRGTVEKPQMKQLAEEWIRYVAGVKEVQNELRVQRKKSGGRRDQSRPKNI